MNRLLALRVWECTCTWKCSLQKKCSSKKWNLPSTYTYDGLFTESMQSWNFFQPWVYKPSMYNIFLDVCIDTSRWTLLKKTYLLDKLYHAWCFETASDANWKTIYAQNVRQTNEQSADEWCKWLRWVDQVNTCKKAREVKPFAVMNHPNSTWTYKDKLWLVVIFFFKSNV